MPEIWSQTLGRYKCYSGKVREMYQVSEKEMLLVATDRISAYDWILPTLIPDKGQVLTSLSDFWFGKLGVASHLIAADIETIAQAVPEIKADQALKDALSGRSMLVRRVKIVPFECVVRGYISGSGWREYKKSQSICGIQLPEGLKESDRLPEPIFTPATKAVEGHDENVSFERMVADIGHDLASRLKHLSIGVYSKAADWARQQGLILADTKFEWGIEPDSGEIILADEVLTPDSSRYWDASLFQPGGAQP
ncbi:MAG: phosphoribosylaminoimidazolesuccinocarboxamide synthase, partial [bacterium]